MGKWRMFRGALLVALLLSLGLSMFSGNAASASDPKRDGKVETGPLLPPPQPSKSLDKTPKSVPDRTAIARTATPSISAVRGEVTVDLKVLVLATDGNEADLPAIQQALDYLGTPYTLYKAAQTPGGLTPDKLTDPTNANHGYYQGLILTNGDLAYSSPSGWASALSTQEWTTLVNYEVSFAVRRLSWYTYPSTDYGFQAGGPGVSTDTPLKASFTGDGASIFSYYVNTANPVPIQYAYTYLGQPLDATTKPILKDPSGNILAAMHTVVDAQNYPLYDTLALTFDSNPYMTHDLVLQFGLVNWVTKGIFLGERHAILTPQPDDLFIDDEMWTPTTVCGTNPEATGVTYRVTGNDFKAYLAWQQSKQAGALTQNFRTEMPFNGVGTTAAWITQEGATPGMYSPDTLTPAAKQVQAQFNWISHTWDHENLDAISYADAVTELKKNNQTASQLGLTNYTKTTLVTPDVSGLTNPNAMQALYDTGVRYVVSNTSLPGYSNPSPNAGIANPLQPAILMIPRHPVNLYYNVSTPDEWLAEDHCLYPAGAYGHVDTYAQLLDRESSMLVTYLLRGDIDPLMFHQPNLRAYDGTHTVLGDLMDAVFAKYSTYVKAPISSPTEQDLGQRMANRMAYNSAGVTAQMVGQNKIVLTAQQAVTVPITGLITDCGKCTAEPYAGQNITWVKLSAGQSINLTPQTPLPVPAPRLSVTGVTPAKGPIAGGTSVQIKGSGYQTGATVTFGSTPATVVSVDTNTLTVTSPKVAAAGVVSVTVTIGNQTATLSNAFTYKATGTSDVGTEPTDTPPPDPAPKPRTAPSGPTTSSSGVPAATPAPIPTGR